jgi:hypothetical protein
MFHQGPGFDRGLFAAADAKGRPRHAALFSSNYA